MSKTRTYKAKMWSSIGNGTSIDVKVGSKCAGLRFGWIESLRGNASEDEIEWYANVFSKKYSK